MKALVKTDPGCTPLKIMDIPTPKCPDNGVLLKVRRVSICGSDLHYYTYAEPMPLPQIMGHEFCGDIVEIGKDVKDWKVGDFVISRVPAYACGTCPECKTGHPERCFMRKSAGLQAQGAYAEYIVTYPDLLYKVPEGVSANMAACCEPSAVALHAIKQFPLKKGMSVAVSGVGMIGLLMIQFLKIYGIDDIYAIGMNSDMEARMPLALKYGAKVAVNAQERSSGEQIVELTGGRGVDLAIDCVGLVPAIDECFKMVAKGGTIGAVGVPGTNDRVSVNWNQMVWRRVSIIPSFYSAPEDWEELIGYMADGRLKFDDAFSHELLLEEWATVFEDRKNPKYVKAVFAPNGK